MVIMAQWIECNDSSQHLLMYLTLSFGISDTRSVGFRELSPELAVRKAEVAAAADVHAKVRELIAQATTSESLMKMPPAFGAWF